LKESLKKFVFSLNISKILECILNKDMKHKKERKRSIEKKEKGREAPKISLLKKGNSIF
jgi:hypothetical protein